MTRRRGRGGAFAAIAAAVVGLAVVLAGGGCELVVGGEVSPFRCVPSASACPAGWTCDPQTQRCVECDPAGCEEPVPGQDATVPADAADAADAASAVHDATATDVASDARPADAAPDLVDAAPPAPDAGDGGPCRGILCPCSGPAGCDSAICANSQTMTFPLYDVVGNSICTQPCCTTADCPGGTVCFGTGQGGNYCVNPAWLGRTAIGAAAAGTTCHANGDCRSGVCYQGACADTCCSAAQSASECGGSTICRFGTFPGLTSSIDNHTTALCGPPVGSKAIGSACANDNDCQTGRCATRCAAPCRGTTDCGGTLGQACYDTPPSLSSKDLVATCILSVGTGAMGESCTANADCQSNFCDMSPNVNKCSDVCFSDADCLPAKLEWRCRPEGVQVQQTGGGSYSVLVCGR